MATIRELLTSWGFDIDTKSLDDMDNRLGDIRNKTDSFGKNLGRLASDARAFGSSMSLFVTAPIIGLGVVFTKAASDAEETLAKFDTVFSEVGKKATETAESLSKDFGLSSRASKELLGDTGDLLTGFGFTSKSALQLSKDVNELAVDLASFTNFSGGAKGASAALTKALLGERESVKSLGISILESDVKAKILALKASGKLTNESERQQKAIATLAIAVEQSKNAIGDFARTQDSLANRTRIFQARLDDLMVSFGQILIPIALKLVNAITEVTEQFTSLEEETKKTIFIVAGLIAVVGPLIFLLGLLGGSILAISKAWILLKAGIAIFRGLSIASLLFQGTFLLIPLAITAGIVAFALFVDDVISFFKGQDSLIGLWVGQWDEGFQDIKDYFRGLGIIGELIFADLTIAAKSWIDYFSFIFDRLVKRLKKAGAAIANVFKPITDLIEPLISKPLKALSNIAGGEFFGKEGVIDTLITKPFNTVASIGAQARTAAATSKSINVDANITVAVPEGTPGAQVAIVKDAARVAVEEIFNEKLRGLASEGPEIE